MADFISQGWSFYIAAVSLLSLVACLVLLFAASRRTVVLKPDGSIDETTGHVWDGDLRELNNPLPRWWMVLFVATVLFSIVYLLLYPGLGSAPGKLGWTSTGEHEEDVQRARDAAAPLFARLAALPAPALAADPAAMAIGERLFIQHCSTCHGSDARGSKGFPNLADKDWLWGGSPEKIAESIAGGRNGVMPPMAAAVGSSEDLRNLAAYVVSLSSSSPPSLAAQLGRSSFTTCAACHGADGRGNPALGAPNLTDNVWLHGWGEQAVISIVTQGKNNAMPAHAQRLTPQQIHVLAAYVWQLSRPAAGGGAGS